MCPSYLSYKAFSNLHSLVGRTWRAHSSPKQGTQSWQEYKPTIRCKKFTANLSKRSPQTQQKMGPTFGTFSLTIHNPPKRWTGQGHRDPSSTDISVAAVDVYAWPAKYNSNFNAYLTVHNTSTQIDKPFKFSFLSVGSTCTLLIPSSPWKFGLFSSVR